MEKIYSYHLAFGEQKHVFERKFITFLEEKPDVEKMKQAALYLEGEHDFRSFCANKRMKKTTVRKLYAVTFREYGDELFIEYRGEGFLYNMVRIMTGTLIEVGQGKRSPKEIESILRGRDRSLAGPDVYKRQPGQRAGSRWYRRLPVRCVLHSADMECQMSGRGSRCV